MIATEHEPYDIRRVPDDVIKHEETLGSKPKFWFSEQGADARNAPRNLFKRIRPDTGEDWSERVAAELARLLGLPHASYDLATCLSEQGELVRGVISYSFLRDGEALVHGNEKLYSSDESYTRDGVWRVYDYSVERVMHVITGLAAPDPPGGGARELFVGYLLFDAWIGNTDRHHENWGLVESASGRWLAPTFDHATSLGRELRPEQARLRLQTRDARQQVDAYLARARSPFYAVGDPPDRRPLHPIDAWHRAARLEAGAARTWLHRLRSLDAREVGHCLERVPASHINGWNRALANRILEINRHRLERD